MGILHAEFRRALSEHFGMAELSKRVLRRAAKSRGIRITDELVNLFSEHCGNPETANARSVELPTALAEVGLGAEDIQRALDELLSATEDGVDKAVLRIVDETPPRILKSLYRDAARAIAERRAIARGCERRLRHTWREPLKRLEMLVIIAHESGEQCLKDFAGKDADDIMDGSPEEAQLLDALVRLHVRACRIASEVLCLLRGGYADGAISRWRSLHEIAVIAMMLAEHQSDVPERYLLHSAVERFKHAEQYQRHCRALGQQEFAPSELTSVRAEYDHFLSRFGDSYKHDFGWASQALGM